MMQGWAPCRCGHHAGVGMMQAVKRAAFVGFPPSLQRSDYILGILAVTWGLKEKERKLLIIFFFKNC